jgi:hypothetical protein
MHNPDHLMFQDLPIRRRPEVVQQIRLCCLYLELLTRVVSFLSLVACISVPTSWYVD